VTLNASSWCFAYTVIITAKRRNRTVLAKKIHFRSPV
jgi:hypothetical protein